MAVSQAHKIGLSAVRQNTSGSSTGKYSGHSTSISYTRDQNVPIFDKGLYAPMRLPLKCDISDHAAKHRMKTLYKYFSGLSDLSQIIWTPKNSLPLQRHSAATMPFISPECLLWILAFCSTAAAGLLENSLWPVWSLTVNSGYAANLSRIQHILPTCCKYRACRNLMCKLVPNPFSPVRNPAALGRRGSKTGQKESQIPLSFISTRHESRIVKSNAGGFQMSGQNAGSVWRRSWANIYSSVS